MELPKGYIRIAGGWGYAPLRVGLVIRAPSGEEVYVQPGDDELAMRENLEALDEIEDDRLRLGIAGSMLGEYFV